MKIIDDIKINQINVLSKMGIDIEKFEVTHSFQYGIVYNIDIKNCHISIYYDWKKNKASIQFYFNDKYKQISSDCFSTKEFHSIIINKICAEI